MACVAVSIAGPTAFSRDAVRTEVVGIWLRDGKRRMNRNVRPGSPWQRYSRAARDRFHFQRLYCRHAVLMSRAQPALVVSYQLRINPKCAYVVVCQGRIDSLLKNHSRRGPPLHHVSSATTRAQPEVSPRRQTGGKPILTAVDPVTGGLIEFHQVELSCRKGVRLAPTIRITAFH